MGLTVSAEGNGLTQRVQKDFAIGTGSKMGSDFRAHFPREFVIEIQRELLQNLETVALAVTWMRRFAGSGLGEYFRCHEIPSVKLYQITFASCWISSGMFLPVLYCSTPSLRTNARGEGEILRPVHSSA